MGGEAISFFADLSIVMVVAATVGLLFSRFNLPLTVGYILAGAFVGPHIGPKLINNEANIQMLSDLGVMFLMFSIGIGFSFRSVRKLGGAVVFPALWDVAFMVLGGFLLGKVLGWGNLECFLLGLILCDSSTSIAAKTLESLGWLSARFAKNTFAIALIEDVLAILLIAVLNGVTGSSSAEGGGDLWAAAKVIGTQLGVLVAFLVGVVVFGILLVPKLMNYVCERFDDEIVLMVALGVCFGVACLAQNGLNLSLVVGAFLAGSIISEARARKRIERTVKPVTNLFASVFFVSVGLMLNPGILWENIGIVLFISAGMILLKLFNNTVACVLVGELPRDAFKVGIGMGQVAEFSFIIAGIAMSGGLSDRPLYQIAVGVALVGSATNPYLLRSSDKLYGKVSKCFGPYIHQLLHWYRQWLGTLGGDVSKGPSLIARIRNAAIMIAVDLVLCAIFFTGVHFAAHLSVVASLLEQINAWQPLEWMYLPWRGIICTVAALIAASPCLFAAQHGWHNLVRLLTKDAWTTSSRGLKHVQRFIRSILHVVGCVGLFIFVALLASTFLRNMWIFGAVALITALLMMRFSKRLRAGYKESREALTHAFDVNVAPPDDFPGVETLMSIHTETYILPKNALVHEKTLGELGLRGATGASVISVASRRNGVSITPGGETVLHSGDAVTVVGSDAQIAQAIAFLARVKKN